MDVDLQGWFTYSKVHDAVIEMLRERFEESTIDAPRVVELGVWKGRSFSYLARKLRKAFCGNFSLIAVDTWDDDQRGPENEFENAELEKLKTAGRTLYGVFQNNMAKLGLCNSIVAYKSTVVAAAADIDRCHFAFLDACHSAAAVCADVLAWKGHTDILAGHDIRESGVREGLEKALSGDPYYVMPESGCWTTSKELADRVNSRNDGVMLAIPAGAVGELGLGTVGAILNTVCARRDVHLKITASSILTHHFNALWCAALNSRSTHKLTHFVLMHADIVPQDACGIWIDLLIDLMNEHDLDVLSVVSPIKDKNGLTSTAIDTDQWRPRRLTMKEVMELPPTFTAKELSKGGIMPGDLLVNTGLMAVRLDRSWSEEVCFHTHDRIVKLFPKDGNGEPWFQAEVEPEDWEFSRWCNRHGLRIGATREVPLLHMGRFPFGNSQPWGTMETDKTNAADAVGRLTRIPVANGEPRKSHGGSGDCSPNGCAVPCLSASP